MLTQGFPRIVDTGAVGIRGKTMALEDEKRENGESIAHWQQEAVSKGVRETRENVVGEEEFFA